MDDFTNIDENTFYYQLYVNLINKCPRDTGNMVTHITLYETENYYEIEIAAPYAALPQYKKSSNGEYSDYASAVNYSPTVFGKYKNPNYHWIENVISRTTEILNGRILK